MAVEEFPLVPFSLPGFGVWRGPALWGARFAPCMERSGSLEGHREFPALRGSHDPSNFPWGGETLGGDEDRVPSSTSSVLGVSPSQNPPWWCRGSFSSLPQPLTKPHFSFFSQILSSCRCIPENREEQQQPPESFSTTVQDETAQASHARAGLAAIVDSVF